VDVVGPGLLPLFRISHREDQRAVLAFLLEGIDQVALFVGFLVLQRGRIEKELLPVYLRFHALEQAVGLDVVEHVGLPEEHHVLVVGIDLLVDVLVQRRIAEVDRAALAEVAVEKVVQLLEQLLAEGRERLERLVDVVLKPGEYALGVVAGLDPHQVDVSGFALDLGPNEHISQGIEEFLFSVHYSPFILAIDDLAVIRKQASQFLRRLTVCVTCVWAGVDSVWEQEKPEARKMLENAAESHTSGARFVRPRF